MVEGYGSGVMVEGQGSGVMVQGQGSGGGVGMVKHLLVKDILVSDFFKSLLGLLGSDWLRQTEPRMEASRRQGLSRRGNPLK